MNGLDQEMYQLLFADDAPFYERFASGQKLAHYTSADNGLKIITGREVWMRHSSVMNDFMELEHGTSCMKEALASPGGQEFMTWLEVKFPGFQERFWTQFRSLEDRLRNDTYLTSVALHDEAEDQYGRLSMWRAYGGRNGVALILNPTAFASESEKVGAYSNRVRYMAEAAFAEWFCRTAAKLMGASELFEKLGDEAVRNWLISWFRINILATKHPGFAEEQEWRIYHTPGIDSAAGILLKSGFETVNGVPQPILRIPLEADPEAPGLDVKELLHRVIIGPSEHSQIIARAYHNALMGAGFEQQAAWNMIGISNIPLRQ